METCVFMLKLLAILLPLLRYDGSFPAKDLGVSSLSCLGESKLAR
jgi:hypothetical protein